MRANLQTIRQRQLGADPIAGADRFFNEHIGIHKLLVVDDEDRLRGLFTISDIERITQEKTNAQAKPARDEKFRLLCGAAVSATRNSTGIRNKSRSWPISMSLPPRPLRTCAKEAFLTWRARQSRTSSPKDPRHC